MLFGMCTCFRHASQRHTRPKDGKILATRDLDSVQLEAENQEFGDLVQGNFLDTYRLVDFSAHCFVFVLSHKTNKKEFLDKGLFHINCLDLYLSCLTIQQ